MRGRITRTGVVLIGIAVLCGLVAAFASGWLRIVAAFLFVVAALVVLADTLRTGNLADHEAAGAPGPPPRRPEGPLPPP